MPFIIDLPFGNLRVVCIVGKPSLPPNAVQNIAGTLAPRDCRPLGNNSPTLPLVILCRSRRFHGIGELAGNIYTSVSGSMELTAYSRAAVASRFAKGCGSADLVVISEPLNAEFNNMR